MKKIIILFVLPFFLFFIIIAGTGDAIASSDRPTTDIDDVSGDENYDDYVPNGDSEIGNAIVTSALSKLGCQYVWGASGPNTFDCSGLVWWACHENGVNFTRTTAAVLSTMGTEVSKDELQPGDIITFKTDPSYVSHVGIYIGDGKMVHAPNKRTVVKVENVFDSNYWQSVLHNYRRLY